jgi:hypothetical protein
VLVSLYAGRGLPFRLSGAEFAVTGSSNAVVS